MKSPRTIRYVCLPLQSSNDGRSIFDARMIESLRILECNVIVDEVELGGRRYLPRLPLWSRKTKSVFDVGNEADADFTIVSHELLTEVAERAAPDAFIIHNYLPAFESKSFPLLSLYYRWQSLRYLTRGISVSGSSFVLSAREQRLAAQRASLNFTLLHPGVPPVTKEVGRPAQNKFKRSGTSDWWPKKKSLLSDHEVLRNFIAAGMGVDGVGEEQMFAVIEDKFVTGFKLKLLDFLFSGHYIISRVDIAEEIISLGCDLRGYYFWNEGELPIQALQADFQNFVKSECPRDRRKYLSRHFSWLKVAARLLDEIYVQNGLEAEVPIK